MIAKMDRVEIICLREALGDVLPYLQQKGLLDLQEVPLEAANIPDFLKRAEIDEEQSDEAARDYELDRMLRELVPLLKPTPTPAAIQAALPKVAEISDEAYPTMVRNWHRGLRALARRRTNANDNLEVLKNYRQLLHTLRPILGDRKVNFGENARALVLQGDTAHTTESLLDRMRAVAGPACEFVSEQVGRKHMVGVLLYPAEKNESVARVLREEGIVPVDAPEASEGETSLQESLKRVDAQIAEQTASKAEIEVQLSEFAAEHGPELAAMQRIIADKVASFKAVDSFAQSEMLAVIHGWAPSDELEALRAGLKREFDSEPIVNSLPMKDVPNSEVPTLLKNPGWLQPFEVLLSILRPPTYGTYDATLLTAVGFVFFYGFIVGDFVYGIAIGCFAHFLRMKWGHNVIVDNAGKVGYYMAASSMLFGALFGEYWGNTGEVIVDNIVQGSHPAFTFGDGGHGDDHHGDAHHGEEHHGEEHHDDTHAATHSDDGHGDEHGDAAAAHGGGHDHHTSVPMLLHRMHEPDRLLLVGVLVGLVHIILSLVLGVRESIRHNHMDHALEKAGMLLAMLGIVVFACFYLEAGPFASTTFMWIAIGLYAAGGVLIFYAVKLMGLVILLEVFSLCGNILSYARLMALGIAGVVVADLANSVAFGALGSGGIVLAIIGVVGSFAIHAFNIALIMFSPTLHSLRLNYVEFLPKFYETEGRHFNPFKKEATW